MSDNRDLRPLLKNISKSISGLREDIQKTLGEVRKVHTVIKDSTEKVLEAIHSNTKAQAELEMIDKVADVEMIRPKIEAKSNRIDSEESELNEKLDQIESRYQQKHEELDEKASERIRDLGEHIFEIDETEFEENIEQPFLDNITAVWSNFRAQNRQISDDRRANLDERVTETSENIDEFVDKQQTLLNKLDRAQVDHPQADGGTPVESNPSDQRTDTVQFPYYVVSFTVNGNIKERTYVPSEVSTTQSRSESKRLQFNELDGLADLVEPNVVASQRHHRSPEEIGDQVGDLFDGDSAFIDEQSIFLDSLADEVKIAIEGESE